MRIFYIRRGPVYKVFLWLLIIMFLVGLGILASREKYERTIAPVYRGSDREKKIALTCNVFWGEEYIPRMLEVLADHQVKITFFVGGTWVRDFPDLLQKIDAAGHEIGSHGYSHPHPDRLSKAGNLQDMQRAEKLIYDTIHKRPRLYAPPYGERGPAVLKAAEEQGYTFILWSIDTIDWQRPAPHVMVRRVVEKAHNGAIVLMHPTAPTVKALPEIIKLLKKEGYQFVTVGELIADLPDQNEITGN
ncbi:polysaccharide deacetylase family protein [Desulforamulus hydrothermalis]|uniref:Polysaccharide deacetylase n=1 Tax=Desulforamulus hydrothermalis Lam5 = DSM 18033 TaxID=1121428 RepID=K8E147_9FIRM|nr:polysaccharide deacetylase family protein [Desulforamulus hydrothermalis]CCO09414.1 Polysaccharide deacetylase [Desulforamulus hydrothermalis Lam5 = DSM 18033]SHH08661.1 probable sporulation protein, polysaccharide deacetylase family [Desulforamulus hydrothermalis Lam5 = DSM 18033]